MRFKKSLKTPRALDFDLQTETPRARFAEVEPFGKCACHIKNAQLPHPLRQERETHLFAKQHICEQIRKVSLKLSERFILDSKVKLDQDLEPFPQVLLSIKKICNF